MDKRGHQCIFLGLTDNLDGVWVLDLELSNLIRCSRDYLEKTWKKEMIVNCDPKEMIEIEQFWSECKHTQDESELPEIDLNPVPVTVLKRKQD